MISPIVFGIRRVPPCEDCLPDGQCTMNCGPALSQRVRDAAHKLMSDIAQAQAEGRAVQYVVEAAFDAFERSVKRPTAKEPQG